MYDGKCFILAKVRISLHFCCPAWKPAFLCFGKPRCSKKDKTKPPPPPPPPPDIHHHHHHHPPPPSPLNIQVQVNQPCTYSSHYLPYQLYYDPSSPTQYYLSYQSPQLLPRYPLYGSTGYDSYPYYSYPYNINLKSSSP